MLTMASRCGPRIYAGKMHVLTIINQKPAQRPASADRCSTYLGIALLYTYDPKIAHGRQPSDAPTTTNGLVVTNS